MTILDVEPVAGPDKEPAAISVRRRRRTGPLDAITLALAVVFAAALGYPIVRMLIQVVSDEGSVVEPFRKAFAIPDIGTTLLTTLFIVVVATVIATVLAIVFAWLNERTNARLGFIAEVLPLTPVLVPALAGAVGWVFLASPKAGMLNVAIRDVLNVVGIDLQQGPIDIFSVQGLIFLYTLNIVPFVYMPVSAAFSRLDPALEEASRVSGVGPFRTLLKVAAPSVRPAIASGMFLGIVVGLGTFSIAVIIGTGAQIDILAVKIYELLTQTYPPLLSEAVALSMLLLVTVLIVSTLQRRILRAGAHATIGGKGAGSSRVDLGRWRWVARGAMLLFVAFTSVLPLLGLLYVSLRGFWTPTLSLTGLDLDSYRLVLDKPETSEAFVNSIVLSAVGAVVTLVVATLFVIYLANRSGVAARLMDGLAKAPGGISHVVIAIAFLTALAGPPFRLSGSLLILIIAFVVFFMPQAYVAASSAHAQISKELGEASAISGANRGRTLRRVTLPLMLPELAGGAAVLFIMMMGEVTGAALLSGSKTPVVGFVMIDLYSSGSFATIAALGVMLTAVTMSVTVLLVFLSKRRTR